LDEPNCWWNTIIFRGLNGSATIFRQPKSVCWNYLNAKIIDILSIQIFTRTTVLIHSLNTKEIANIFSKFWMYNSEIILWTTERYIQRNERICMFCVNNNIRVIEDEYHFIFICPLYQQLRSTFLKGILRDKYFCAYLYLIQSKNKCLNMFTTL
jgi:hypothetical protein